MNLNDLIFEKDNHLEIMELRILRNLMNLNALMFK
jgi:hypothetical protein